MPTLHIEVLIHLDPKVLEPNMFDTSCQIINGYLILTVSHKFLLSSIGLVFANYDNCKFCWVIKCTVESNTENQDKLEESTVFVISSPYWQLIYLNSSDKGYWIFQQSYG